MLFTFLELCAHIVYAIMGRSMGPVACSRPVSDVRQLSIHLQRQAAP